MESAIVGREREKEVLARLLASNQPEFLVLYGRRRVGKTYLIHEYFEDKGIFLEVTGSVDTATEIHLARFGVELSHTFPHVPSDKMYAGWDQAMSTLVDAVHLARGENPDSPIVLFFDEAPWLDAGNSGFLGALDYAWNRHLSKRQCGRVLLVVCGSASSWIIKRVIDNKGGLHNRVTQTIRLMPFDLRETEAYLESRNVRLENKHIIEIYMALGGIPTYLSRVLPGLSSAQIINSVCFTSGENLVEEFGRLYRALFKNSRHHVAIVRALASEPRGMTRQRIIDKAGLSDGGETSVHIKELEECGFVASIPSFGKKQRGRMYRLIDEYSLFYLKWIEPAVLGTAGDIDDQYWLRQSQRPSWTSWAGYAFEGLCLKNIAAIKRALGIAGVSTSESSWYCGPDAESGESGAQVDLVIDRADATINLCELKFVGDEFTISSDYRKTLEHKKQRFRRHTNTRSLLLTTLITSYGVKENRNYLGVVDNQLTMDCLF